MNKDMLKQKAAERAVEFVQSGMVVGLGEGSTAIWATRSQFSRTRVNASCVRSSASAASKYMEWNIGLC